MRIWTSHFFIRPASYPRGVRLVAMMLAVLLAASPLPAQSPVPPAAPTRLKIRAITATPLTEFAGTLSANVLQVRITDEWDMPVRGATVSFRLPEVGPGGVFLNGLSSEIALTDERGEAAVRGFDWRADAGVTFVHVIAALGGARAGAMVEVHLARKIKDFPATVATPSPDAASASPSARRVQPAAPDVASPPPVRQPAPRVEDAPPASNAPAAPAPQLGQQAQSPVPDAERAALLPAVSRAPRDMEPEDAGSLPTMVRVKGKPVGSAASGAGDPASQALVKARQSNGGGISKVLVLLLAAGAAAGGAVAMGMGRGGGSSGTSPGAGTVLPPVIRIGNPTITISGGK